MQQAANQMTTGDYHVRVDVTSKDEIGGLSLAFNQMAEAIRQEDEAQKSFLATVSHELRTPISYVKGYSEAIQNGFIEEKKRDEAIQLIVRESARMERLTNELMQLARNEEVLELAEHDPLVLAETIRDACSLLQQKAYAKNVHPLKKSPK